MKTLTNLLLAGIGILACHSTCFCQETKGKSIKTYNAIITTSGQAGKLKGILQEVRDTSILILSANRQVWVQAATIQEVRIKRTGAAGRGALAGGLIGLFAGAIAGYASGDDPPCSGSWFCNETTAEEKALGLGLTMSMGGALVGTIIGSLSKVEKIVIKGDKHIYKKNVETMKKYAQYPSLLSLIEPTP